MNLPLVYPSAFEFWMNQYSYFGEPFTQMNGDFDPNIENLLAAGKYLNLAEPLHTGTADKSVKIKRKNLLSHVLPPELPAGSFIQIEDGICISSPELCFLQAARFLPLAVLVKIANDLCGNYYLNPNAKKGQGRREPLCSLDSLSSYLDKVSGMYGVHKARQALKYASENSFSPYESRIAAAGTLPMCLGGYKIKKAQLNDRISLSSQGVKILGRNTCVCDMVWPEERVVFEYDSNSCHLDPRQHSYDKKRQMAITLSGYQLISATAEDFSSFGNSEKIFLLIRKALGLRTHADRLKKTLKAREQVYQQLFRDFDPDATFKACF